MYNTDQNRSETRHGNRCSYELRNPVYVSLLKQLCISVLPLMTFVTIALTSLAKKPRKRSSVLPLKYVPLAPMTKEAMIILWLRYKLFIAATKFGELYVAVLFENADPRPAEPSQGIVRSQTIMVRSLLKIRSCFSRTPSWQRIWGSTATVQPFRSAILLIREALSCLLILCQCVAGHPWRTWEKLSVLSHPALQNRAAGGIGRFLLVVGFLLTAPPERNPVQTRILADNPPTSCLPHCDSPERDYFQRTTSQASVPNLSQL